MAMQVENISAEIIKPSSHTPSHLRNVKICLLDQLAPPFYVPVVLFYSSSDLNEFVEAAEHSISVTQRLKTSLSKALSYYYPLCGKVKGNSSIHCNDEGAVYKEARAHVELSSFLANPDINELQQFLPFSPYKICPNLEEQFILGVQVTTFNCGGIGLGVCISHKIADGATVSSFLTTWAEIALTGKNCTSVTPFLRAHELFQPKDINFQMPPGVISNERLSTKRFHFNGENLSRLQTKFTNGSPTRVEAVTALIWKSAVEATKKRPETIKKGDRFLPTSSAVTHVVNIRSRMRPPLPENALGNLWQSTVAVAPSNKELGLQDLAGILRRSIRRIDGEYLSELQGENGLAKACESLMAARKLASNLDAPVELYRFSSWARFPFYEADFGWGRPTWVCTTSTPMKNVTILMGTRCGGGMEAWITLAEQDMIEFERDEELLQFVSPANAIN